MAARGPRRAHGRRVPRRAAAQARDPALADAGTPIVAARPETEGGAAYRRMAARLWAKLNGAEAPAGPRIVIE
jgi:hypothetical protein